MINQIISFVGNIAPTIATALGSPVAGAIIRLLGNAFGVSQASPANPGELLTAMQGNPNAHDILSNLEQQHACWLAPLVAAGRPENVEISIRIGWPAS